MAGFHVLIVGGSVAGLTLANILEQYGIEYTVIEKHRTIAPQVGASIGMLPHGSRILEQLGCYHEIRAMSGPVTVSGVYGPDGNALNINPKSGDGLKEMLGYKMLFLDRQQLIETLFQKLVDKSRIYASCGALKVEHMDQGVRVETYDGRVFTGSIVVGSDGVHSQVRQEMWRIMDAQIPGSPATDDRNAIKSMYSCMFGISKGVNKLTTTNGGRCCQQGRHYLLQTGADDKMYWFAFVKNEKQLQRHKIPRYTTEDRERLAAELRGDRLMPNLTFGDVYDNKLLATLVPLEEFVLNRWYHGRIILMGDSVHKVHPLSGQGGNSAIESAVYLANHLRDLTRDGSVPTDAQLQTTFADFEEARRPRTEFLMHAGHGLARMESLDTPFRKFLMLRVLSKIPDKFILPFLAEACVPAVPLKYLPLPPRRFLVPYEDEIKLCPRRRSIWSTIAWVCLFLMIGSVQFILPRNRAATEWQPTSHLGPEANFAWSMVTAFSLPLHVYFTISLLAVNGLWCLESYRNQFIVSPFCSSIPFVLISSYAGWDITVPLYFALYVLLSHKREFYYPTPRTIEVPVAKALPIGLVLTYTTAICYALVRDFGGTPPIGFGPTLWQTAHAGLPVVVSAVREALKGSIDIPTGAKSIWTDADIPYLSRFQGLIIFVTTTAHVLFMASCARLELGSRVLGLTFSSTEDIMQYAFLGLAIILWLVFTVWDLRRVNATDVSWRRTVLYITLGTVLFGPASCLAATWLWREVTLERSRTREAVQSKVEA